MTSSAAAPENRTNVAIPNKLIHKVRALEEDGLKTGEIAIVLGIHRSTVSKYRLDKQKGSIPPIAEEKVDEIRRLRRDGVMTKDIAARVGVSEPTVVKYAGAVRPRINRGKLAQQIAELEAKGIFSRLEQAKILGVHRNTLYIHVGPTRWANATVKDLQDIRERYRQGETTRNLAQEYGVSRQTIYNVLNYKDRYKFL